MGGVYSWILGFLDLNIYVDVCEEGVLNYHKRAGKYK
jgi:hypothetical protein